MYSGIIRHKGTMVGKRELPEGGAVISFEAPKDLLGSLESGSSINVGGVCLTVVNKDRKSFTTEVMPQTLRLSTASEWQIGTAVNLEPSLRLGEELGGHLIFGHVDGVATIVDDCTEGNARVLTFRAGFEHRFVPRGSISLDGVSLTISTVPKDGIFCVSMSHETLWRTTFQDKNIGDHVNTEIDILQRYAESYGPTHQPPHSSH